MSALVTRMQKLARRSVWVERILSITLRVLGPRKWMRFWLVREPVKTITLARTTYALRGSSIIHQLADLGVLIEIAIDHEYGAYRIKRSDVIVDIGANIGGFSVLAARKASKGRVVACEPYPPTYAILECNIKLNDLRNVRAHNAAIVRGGKSAVMFVNPINPGENSLVTRTGRQVRVHATTLEALMRNERIGHIDLLKLDCEGSEYDILYGSRKALRLVGTIILEYHVSEWTRSKGEGAKHLPAHDRTPEALGSYLKKQGFTVDIITHNRYQGKMIARRSSGARQRPRGKR